MTDTARRNALIAIMVCVTVMGIGWGLSLPILALLMNDMGVSRTVIGLNSALPAIATLVLMPFMPWLLRRYGIKPVLQGSLATITVMILSFKVFETIWAWFPIRFIMGLGLAGLFVATEVWINMIAEERSRGRILGIYATCLSGGFAIGAAIMGLMGIEGWGPFLAAAGLMAMALVLVLLLPIYAPPLEEDADGHGSALWPYLLAAPAAMGAVAVFGAVEMGIFGLLPVYGVRSGLSEGMAANMLVVVAAGNVLLQVPIGMLADRIDRRLVLVICAVSGVLGALLIPVTMGQPWLLYPTLFMMGGVIVGLYTVGLVLIGERFTGTALAGANAAFIIMYGVGSLIGPPIAGIAMDVWDPHGLMAVLGTITAAYVVLAGTRYWQNRVQA